MIYIHYTKKGDMYFEGKRVAMAALFFSFDPAHRLFEQDKHVFLDVKIGSIWFFFKKKENIGTIKFEVRYLIFSYHTIYHCSTNFSNLIAKYSCWSTAS